MEDAASSEPWFAQIADRVMIQDLVARYAWEIDHGSPRVWAQLFHAEGSFEVPALSLQVVGHEALEQFAKQLQTEQPGVHHLTTNVVIDLEGDHARCRCALNEFIATPDNVLVSVQGWYDDMLIRENGRWRFLRRRVFIQGPDLAMS